MNLNNISKKCKIKWRNLSYQECNWEDQEFVTKNFPEKLKDFKRFNRALIKD